VAFNPSPDMVQEVRVQTTTFDASVGHSGGATVDVVLKSGTNQAHGAFTRFFRNKEWNAALVQIQVRYEIGWALTFACSR